MAAPISTVATNAVSADAARPLLDALAARTEPGAVLLAGDDSIWNGLRWVLGVVVALLVVASFALLGTRFGHRALADKDRMYFPMFVYVWLGLWAFSGPFRLWRRKRNLPWKPGVYAIGPHVVDARKDKLRFFAITGVTADIDGERSADRPCRVHVDSTWKRFTIAIAGRDVAVRVRDQLTAAQAAAREPSGAAVPGDVLAPLVAPSGAVRPGVVSAVQRESLPLRWAWLTTGAIAGAVGPLLVYVR